MFTGLIEALGTVEGVQGTSNGIVLTVKAPELAQSLSIGDSVSTNGVCLTVSSKSNQGFTADVMSVTLENTNLGKLRNGSYVNLERAMKLSDRLDGHIVTGHVDAKGYIREIRNDGNATIYRIELQEDVVARMIDRGSIAIDGISLTTQTLLSNGIEVSIIPHTSEVTTLSKVRVGDEVNVERDVIGKYVERLLGNQRTPSNVSMNLLSRAGFL